MDIKADIAVKLAHDTIKPIRAYQTRLEMMDSMPQSKTPEQERQERQMWIQSLGSIRQALEDLQTLALCNESSLQKEVDWTALINKHTEYLHKKSQQFEFTPLAHVVQSTGRIGLLNSALYNLAWFSTHYSNRLKKLEVSLTSYKEKAAIRILHQVETAGEFAKELSNIEPFTPMSKSSLALTHNTGLVLFCIKAIADVHGGKFSAIVTGRDVALEFICPLGLTKQEHNHQDPVVSKMQDPSTKTILIIDDDPFSLEMIALFATSKGYNVETAENGTKAIAILERTKIDLLILDLSGEDVMKRMIEKPAWAKIPIIIDSALSWEKEEPENLEKLFKGKLNYRLIERPSSADNIISMMDALLS